MIRYPRLRSQFVPAGALLAAFALGWAAAAGVGSSRPLTATATAAPAATEPSADTPGASPALRGRQPGHHPAEVLAVLDGDTFEARVLLWPGLSITTRVRLRGIDTPEMRAQCRDERVRAEAARDALRTLLDGGEVGLSAVTLDKYGGRVLAAVSTATTPDVSEALLRSGVARPYAGKRRDGWCP